MMKNSIVKNFLYFFLAFVVIAALMSFYQPTAKPTEINLSQLLTYINNNEVTSLATHNSKITITLNSGEKKIAYKDSAESITTLLKNFDVNQDKLQKINLNIQQDSATMAWLGNILPFLIPFLIVGLFIWLMMRQVQGANNRAMSFGQSGAKSFNEDANNKTTFADVAGAAEAKSELSEVVDFLKNPNKFLTMGAKIPKGVLLLGAPGTGKTLLARAIAGEAKVPFFHISGSEFVEMFVGVGASRVRDLFRKAKKAAPCIIFVDEIDAVGRQRGSGLGGSHDEREQTLNQILVEMDGFESNTNIIVIAATNRPDVLDPALLRPGRFDRQVVIDLPDMKDRQAILDVHAKNKPLNQTTDLQRIATMTPGFSGADLANTLNEAAILAARNNQKEISQNDILVSIEKVMMGPERKSHILSAKEKNITAYHEAGHALVAHFLPEADPVHKVSIIARGRAGGYTLKLPIEDRHLRTEKEFISDIAVALAGVLTEKEVFNEMTTGASSDLQKVTEIARQVVTQYGMNKKLGLRSFGQKEEMIFLGKELHERRDYSEKTAEEIDHEVTDVVNTAQKLAVDIITHHRTELDKIAQELLVKETLEKEEFEKLLA